MESGDRSRRATITAEVEAAAEVVAEAAAEAAVVARSPHPPPTGGGLRSYRIAPTLAVECSTSYTATASAVAAAAVHILPTIGRMTMRAAGGQKTRC